MACIQKGLIEYNEELIEGSYLSKDDISSLMNELSGLTSNEISIKYKSVVEGREDVLLAGTILLYKILEILRVKKITVSTKGIRYGAIEKFLVDNF